MPKFREQHSKHDIELKEDTFTIRSADEEREPIEETNGDVPKNFEDKKEKKSAFVHPHESAPDGRLDTYNGTGESLCVEGFNSRAFYATIFGCCSLGACLYLPYNWFSYAAFSVPFFQPYLANPSKFMLFGAIVALIGALPTTTFLILVKNKFSSVSVRRHAPLFALVSSLLLSLIIWPIVNKLIFSIPNLNSIEFVETYALHSLCFSFVAIWIFNRLSKYQVFPQDPSKNERLPMKVILSWGIVIPVFFFLAAKAIVLFFNSLVDGNLVYFCYRFPFEVLADTAIAATGSMVASLRFRYVFFDSKSDHLRKIAEWKVVLITLFASALAVLIFSPSRTALFFFYEHFPQAVFCFFISHLILIQIYKPPEKMGGK